MGRVRLRYLYVTAPDVGAVRAFYVDLLGMLAGSYREGPDAAWLVLKTDGLELMFFRGEPAGPEGFAWQPGGDSGELRRVSWSIEVAEGDFADTVARLVAAGTRSTTPEPTWRQGSYWGFTVLDPAGNTVEVYTTVANKPDGEPKWKPPSPA